MPGVLQVAVEINVVSASERDVVIDCVFFLENPTRALPLQLFLRETDSLHRS